ncbi:hypothetical protein KR054_001205, partial [Drosophila jambulina]
MSFNCLHIVLYIVLVLNPLVLCYNTSAHYKCGHCAKENAKLCQIESSTGYSCFKKTSDSYSQILDQRRKYQHEKAPMSNDVSLCIPPKVEIGKKPGEEICCAWSPHTGCNLVLEKSHRGEFCSTCRIQNKLYKGLKICPCISTGKSGSGELIISSYLKILIRLAVGF